MSGEVVQSIRDRWSHVTATWANNKETGVSHVGDTSEATSYSKRKLNMAKSLIVTLVDSMNRIERAGLYDTLQIQMRRMFSAPTIPDHQYSPEPTPLAPR